MTTSIVRKEILPFLAVLVALLVGTTLADAVLHQLDLVWVGRYLGIPGTLLILLSFGYSLRKRKIIGSGDPRSLLVLHQALTLLGALMILVHAGVHVYAILPWLALAAMLVNVVSGITGQYLLGRSRRRLAEAKGVYAQRGLADKEVEQTLFWDAIAVDLMKRWRAVHFPITVAFAVLALAHVVSIALFWQWR
jgi:hypothetical protein